MAASDSDGRHDASAWFEDQIESGFVTPSLVRAVVAAWKAADVRDRVTALFVLRSIQEHEDRAAPSQLDGVLDRNELIESLGNASLYESIPLRKAILWPGWGPLEAQHLPALYRALGDSPFAEIRIAILRGAAQVVAVDDCASRGQFFAHLERRIAIDSSREVRKEATALLRSMGGAPVPGETHLPWAAPDLTPSPGAIDAWIDALRWGYGDPEDRFDDATDVEADAVPQWVLEAVPQVCTLLPKTNTRTADTCLIVVDRLARVAMRGSRDDPEQRGQVERAFAPWLDRLTNLVASSHSSVSGIASSVLARLAPRSQEVVDALVQRIRLDHEEVQAQIDMDRRICAAGSILASTSELDAAEFLELAQRIVRDDPRPRVRLAAAQWCIRVLREAATDDLVEGIIAEIGETEHGEPYQAAVATASFVALDPPRRLRAYASALARVMEAGSAHAIARAALAGVAPGTRDRPTLLRAIRDCDAFWFRPHAIPEATEERRIELLRSNGLPESRDDLAAGLDRLRDPLPRWMERLREPLDVADAPGFAADLASVDLGPAHVEVMRRLVDQIYARPADAEGPAALMESLLAQARRSGNESGTRLVSEFEARLPWSELARLVLSHDGDPRELFALEELFRRERVLDRDAVHALVDVVQNGRDVARRVWAVNLLGSLHDSHRSWDRRAAIEVLATLAESTSDRSLRRAAAAWAIRLECMDDEGNDVVATQDDRVRWVGALRSSEPPLRAAAGFELTILAQIPIRSLPDRLALISALGEALRLHAPGERDDVLLPLAAYVCDLDRVPMPAPGLQNALESLIEPLIAVARDSDEVELSLAVQCIRAIRPPSSELVNALVVRLGGIEDDELGAEVRAALGEMSRTHPGLGAGSFGAWAEVRLAEAKSVRGRWEAVRDWISGMASSPPQKAVEILVAGCGSSDPAEARAAATAAECLATLDEGARHSILLRAASAVRDPHAAAVLVSILTAVELAGETTPLPETMRIALRAVADCEPYWLQSSRPHAFAGFPVARVDLDRFLGGRE